MKLEEVIKDQTPYIFGRLCSEKETPTKGIQTFAQTLLYSDSVHEILQSNLLQFESYRRRKSKIRHSHIGLRHIYSDTCAQNKKHLRVALRYWHKPCSIVTLYMKYYSQIYCSPRAIGDNSPKSDTAIIGRRHFFSKMAYHRLCSDQNRL